MCGIVTAIARRNIVPVLLEGLRKLEYRGYDSAGLAVLKTEGTPELTRLRAVGRVAELAAQADATQLSANIGIAHTRWATHGVPSERNAHPHISGGLAVVHNGIIENFEELRSGLQAKGYTFTSETDTEAIAHLLHDKLKTIPDLFDAVRATVAELVGAYAIGVVAEIDKLLTPDTIVVADASYSSIWVADGVTIRKGGQRVLTPRGLAGLGWGLPFALGAKAARPAQPATVSVLVQTTLSGLVSVALGMTLLLLALKRGDVGMVAILSSVTPILLLPLLWLRLRRVPAKGAWCGAAITVIGTALILSR